MEKKCLPTQCPELSWDVLSIFEHWQEYDDRNQIANPFHDRQLLPALVQRDGLIRQR
jgi:hypothetical protein